MLVLYSEEYRSEFVELYQTVWREAPAYREVFTAEEVRLGVIEKLEDLWLAFRGGQLVGFVGGLRLSLSGEERIKELFGDRLSDVYYLDELGVAPDLQGQRLGTEILSSFIETLRQRGLRVLVLKTADDPLNHAPRLYRKCDFRILRDESGNEITEMVAKERTDGSTRADRRVFYFRTLDADPLDE